ncbi:ankyrin repeat and fibronectin type-III domain-containing protein 1 [Engraulis encrasicolus]|uniref:ankyrin repeat and fibronectin type-III domain-containing protein 1 n=1 Tax=Engraulis encrasicolus TaxID=184585 RepID=UPI002FD797E9
MTDRTDVRESSSYMRWLRMSCESESRASSCVFQTAEERDEIPGMGDDSVLEMLSYSKFSDLEAWLCMPSTLFPRTQSSWTLSPLTSDGEGEGDTQPDNRSCDKSSANQAHLSERSSPSPPSPTSSLLSPPSSLLSPSSSLLSPPSPISPSTRMSPLTSTPATSSSSSSSSSSTLNSTTTALASSLLSSSSTTSSSSTPLLSSSLLSSSTPLLSSSLLSSSTPPLTSSSRGSGRKRRRLAASPGGLHWDASGAVLRDYERSDGGRSGGGVRIVVGTANHSHLSSSSSPSSPPFIYRSSPPSSPPCVYSSTSTSSSGAPGVEAGVRTNLPVRKALSVDDSLLLCPPHHPHQRILTRLDKGRKKLRNIHSLGSTGRYEPRKKSDSKIQRLAQRLNRHGDGALIREFRPLLFLPGTPGTSQSLDRGLSASSMTQQMQSLQLTQGGRSRVGPASPSAAKRLYRNLSEKLKGGHASFEDGGYFFGRSRKASTLQSSEVLFDAVEQQDLDAVQMLLYQYTAEELDMNTPTSEGLTPLDVALMTNNAPIARLLIRAGAKESPHFTSLESREAHLNTLVEEADRRAGELANQVMRETLTLDSSDKDKQLKAWEWRCRLYKRMRTGFQHSRAPDAPVDVRLSVTSSSSLTVTFQEPSGLNSAVVTKYRVEWSCLKDFSHLAGEMLLENLQTLKCTITGLTTGRMYYVQVCAYNMKGWGPPQQSTPPSAAPSNWKDVDGREARRRGHIEAMERLLQQVRATHQQYSCPDPSKLQNCRKQSVSRSLKHLFASSSKFVKTLKRGIYVAAVFYHRDSVCVTGEDHIPIVEVDDSYSSSFMQDFLWFTKLSCMWDDVRWLRQSMAVSSSSSTTLQARQKILNAVGQLQNLLGTHNLGRVHYEPIKDRHGNLLLLSVREAEGSFSFLSSKWLQVSKLQSQRKSLSTPEEPYALDILLITLQDIVAYHRRSVQRLSPGLYLGYLKLSSSVDQIRVLVPQRTPNMLCHTRLRDNSNVSREEWEWLQSLSGAELDKPDDAVDNSSPSGRPIPLQQELQTGIRSLLRQINIPLTQAQQFRVYSQEVLELGHGVCFLLLLPSSESVCSAPGQANPYTPLSGFLNLPLQMFELVHFCTYKERFISLYCRLSSVLELDALITQQALREAITDPELTIAKQRHQHITDFIQHMDEIWRDVRWLTDALQYARYKQPGGGVSISNLLLLDGSEEATSLLDGAEEGTAHKSDSTSSNTDYVTTPSPSPKPRRRKATSDFQTGSDEEEGCSEVFLPTDSDYDSSEALSPRDTDTHTHTHTHTRTHTLFSSAQDLSQQTGQALSGSAPNMQLSQSHHSLSALLQSPSAMTHSPSAVSQSNHRTTLSPSPVSSRSCLDPASFSRQLDDLSISPSPSPSPLSRLPKSNFLYDHKSNDLSINTQSSSSSSRHFLSDPPITAKRKLLSKSHPARSHTYFPFRLQSDVAGIQSASQGVYTSLPQSELAAAPSLALALPLAPIGSGSAPVRSPSREPKPSVRRIFVEPCESSQQATPTHPRQLKPIGSPARGGAGGGASKQEVVQEVDSDEQTDEQVSEILSSTL